VAGLVAQVHHDFARVLEVVALLLDARERRMAEVEGNADGRLPGRAAPFVGQVEGRREASNALRSELADQPARGDGRALTLRPRSRTASERLALARRIQNLIHVALGRLRVSRLTRDLLGAARYHESACLLGATSYPGGASGCRTSIRVECRRDEACGFLCPGATARGPEVAGSAVSGRRLGIAPR
jgi:hypothetical protein